MPEKPIFYSTPMMRANMNAKPGVWVIEYMRPRRVFRGGANMSMIVKCEICGKDKEVPAYPGDSVYSTHICEIDDERSSEMMRERARYGGMRDVEVDHKEGATRCLI